MSRPPPSRVEGILVGSLDYGETDRILRVLSPEVGRRAFLARRARQGGRRGHGALEVGNKVELMLRPGHGDLYHLDAAELLDGHIHARSDLDRLTLLAYGCEVAAALSREGHPEPRLYGLLDMLLTLIDAMSGPPGALLRLAFEAKALSFAGYAPALDRCAACDGPLGEEALRWSPSSGGALHDRCRVQGEERSEPIDAAFLVAVEAARRAPMRLLIDAEAPPGPLWSLADLIEHHTGQGLKCRALLSSLPPPG